MDFSQAVSFPLAKKAAAYAHGRAKWQRLRYKSYFYTLVGGDQGSAIIATEAASAKLRLDITTGKCKYAN